MKKNRIAVRRSMKRAAGFAGLSTAFLVSTAALAGGVSLLYTTVAMPDSLIAKWLVRPLAAASVASVSSSGGLPTVNSTTKQATPGDTTKLPMKLGMNLNEALYYQPNRIFANLAAGMGWEVQSAAGGDTSSYFDANRNVIKVNTGDTVYRPVLRPGAVFAGKTVDVVCKWEGKGTIEPLKADGFRNQRMSANQFSFTYVSSKYIEMLYLKSVDANDPIRNMDCREAGLDPKALFHPDYLATVSRYSTVRFLGWQLTNGNKPVTWATRSRPEMGNILAPKDGYPIEYMIELANQAKVNPWFLMPWNADEDYYRRFAQLVHDRLDPKLTAYVETSNEVWNGGFPVTNQAYEEGKAAGLGKDYGTILLNRYAQKSGEVLDIWKSVFADNPKRLVRVVAGQNALPWAIQTIMAFKDTPSKVDAVASAPYFDYNLDTNPVDVNNLDPFFATLKTTMDKRLAAAAEWKATAQKYGKRYITYEAGQHVTGSPVDTAIKIQHDPRMGQLYKYYLTKWNENFGDQMMLLSDYAENSKWGLWGHFDYVGQNPTLAPKANEITLMMASLGK